MAARELLIKILGDPSDAVRALKTTGDEADRTGGRMHKAGQMAAAAFAVAGAAAVAFAASSVKAFSDTAAAIDDMQDVTGESAESMSRLRYAFKSWGVDDETMQKSLLKLTKAVAGGSAVFEQYGIAIKDAAGNTLPMSQVVANAAQVFATMPDGIDKSNLAMQLFGKTGTELLDVMNEGSAGLAELGAEADKYGITIGQDAVDAQQRNARAQRQMKAAWEGLQIQIGQHLMPVIARLTGWLAQHLPGAIATVKAVIERLQPVFRAIGTAAGALFAGLKAGIGWLVDHKELLIGFAAGVGAAMLALFIPWAIAAASAAAATLAAAAPFIALGLAVAGVVAAAVWMVENWDAIWTKVKEVVGAAVDWITGTFNTFIGFIGGIWDGIEDAAQGAWDKVTGIVRTVIADIKAIISGIWDGLKDGFKAAINWVIEKFNWVINQANKVPFVDIPNIPLLHTGGIVPGIAGQDVLIMAQAGERIIGTRQAGRNTPAGPAGGPLPPIVNHFNGITDVEAITRLQARELGWQLRIAA